MEEAKLSKKISEVNKAILEAEKVKNFELWEMLNDQLELLLDEEEKLAKLRLAQKKWDEMSKKDKELYNNRPKSFDDIEIIKSK